MGIIGTAVAVPLAACSVGSPTRDAASSSPAPPRAKLTYTPAAGAAAPSPIDPIAVAVTGGRFADDITLSNPSGHHVKLGYSADKSSITVGEPLGYGVTYQWAGTAVGDDGIRVPVNGTVTTLAPQSTTSVVINVADGQTVGIAAPLILKFDAAVENKAAVEKALTIETTPTTEGSWAWLPDDNGSRVHWRPKNYWAPGTTVTMKGDLYGLDYGAGAYGDSDVTSNFTIGRAQIVVAEASSFQIRVMRGNTALQEFPCSYGEGDLPRNVTRSGIHVVSEKHEDFYMSNPDAGYFNVHEQFAVRISNNGEFIHANPNTTGVQGAVNVTNGCINLSLEHAQQYFAVAIYGDPVEVTGTSIALSEADGDIYDWTLDWATWQSMSALA